MVVIARVVLAALFAISGTAHLVKPALYRLIMPPWLPAPDLLIAISGIAEVAGAAALLHRRTRKVAGILLILLLIAIFPANVEMLRIARRHGDGPVSEALLWLRLPLQGLLIWWAWRVSRPRGRGDALPEKA